MRKRRKGTSYACAPSDSAINGSRDQSFSDTGSVPSSPKQNSISGPLFATAHTAADKLACCSYRKSSEGLPSVQEQNFTGGGDSEARVVSPFLPPTHLAWWKSITRTMGSWRARPWLMTRTSSKSAQGKRRIDKARRRTGCPLNP